MGIYQPLPQCLVVKPSLLTAFMTMYTAGCKVTPTKNPLSNAAALTAAGGVRNGGQITFGTVGGVLNGWDFSGFEVIFSDPTGGTLNWDVQDCIFYCYTAANGAVLYCISTDGNGLNGYTRSPASVTFRRCTVNGEIVVPIGPSGQPYGKHTGITIRASTVAGFNVKFYDCRFLNGGTGFISNGSGSKVYIYRCYWGGYNGRWGSPDAHMEQLKCNDGYVYVEDSFFDCRNSPWQAKGLNGGFSGNFYFYNGAAASANTGFDFVRVIHTGCTALSATYYSCQIGADAACVGSFTDCAFPKGWNNGYVGKTNGALLTTTYTRCVDYDTGIDITAGLPV